MESNKSAASHMLKIKVFEFIFILHDIIWTLSILALVSVKSAVARV
jgi:hypothetical protein